MQYFWRKNGPRDYRVYFTRFGANSECVSLHTTKRSAIAAIDKFNAKILRGTPSNDTTRKD